MISIKKTINHQWIILLVIILFFAGLIFSRAVLSITSVLIIIPFLFNKETLDVSERKLVLCFMLLLLPVLASYFWSSDKNTWMRFVFIKLPLLFIPIGLLSIKNFEKQTWIIGTKIIIAIVLLCSVWSVWNYSIQIQEISKSYLVAKLIPTVLDNDHVRFSWLVVLAIILLVHICFFEWLSLKTLYKFLYGLICVWFVFYLHLLASKTGLVCMYLSVFLGSVFLLKDKRFRQNIYASWVFLIVVSILSFIYLPTLRNRVQYIQYDYSIYSKGEFVSGLNDGARVLSWKAGVEIFKENIIAGTGFGDIPEKVRSWHQTNYPSSQLYEQFLPLNEWLVYASASGVMGLLVFSFAIFWMLILIWETKNVFVRISFIISLVPLLIDDSLEGQFGVFLFSFFIIWWYLFATRIEKETNFQLEVF